MSDKEKNKMFIMIVVFAIVILLAAGSTFAYFQTTTNSDEGAITTKSAEFKMKLTDDITLIKGNIIPSIEDYVDKASTRRDEKGNFLKPYVDEATGETVTAKTACIDDNLREICSIYTFTVTNETELDIPLYFTLEPKYNTFENIYFKIIDPNNNVVMPATRIIDDRYELDESGNYLKDEAGKLIKKPNYNELKASPIVLTGINNQTLKATTDPENPSEITYSIVMWIMETGIDQTEQDGGKIFASTLKVEASGGDGRGITGTISAAGRE